MKKNEKVNKLAVFFTISILEIASVAGLFVYKGYLIGKKSEVLHSETKILQEKTAIAQVANDLEKQKIEKENKIKQAQAAFFTDQSLMDFLKELSDITGAYNLYINSISFGGLKNMANTTPPIQLLPINISIAGKNYDDIVHFMSYLERKGYSLKFNNISIGKFESIGSGGSRSNATNLSVAITIYVQTNSKGKWSYKSGD